MYHINSFGICDVNSIFITRPKSLIIAVACYLLTTESFVINISVVVNLLLLVTII